MAMDLSQSLITLRHAAKLLPGRPHVSTLHRWCSVGVRGVRLESCLVGGVRYVTRESLQQFVDVLSKKPGHSSGEDDSNSARKPAGLREAESALDAAGI